MVREELLRNRIVPYFNKISKNFSYATAMERYFIVGIRDKDFERGIHSFMKSNDDFIIEYKIPENGPIELLRLERSYNSSWYGGES